MGAKVIRVDGDFDPKILSEAVELLKNDQVVAIPTETVYGLAANALKPAAIKHIFQAKSRPSDNPLIVHISSLSMLYPLIKRPQNFDLFETLMSAFWPGPLTFLFSKSSLIPEEVTGGLSTVCIRFPENTIARAIIDQCGFPLAAPSANISGRPSPTEASHVLEDLKERIPLIVDGGPCSKGVESTVINLLSDPPMILRSGSITLEMLRKFVPNVQIYQPEKGNELDPISNAALASLHTKGSLSPGMKYRHYSPKANLFLLESTCFDDDQTLDLISKLERFCEERNIRGSILLNTPICKNIDGNSDPHLIIDSFSSSSYQTIARELFAKLRKLDSLDVKFILMFSITNDNEGSAVMNRVLKASHSVLTSTEQVTCSFQKLFI
ncbi:hypothetical protein MDAP_001932 [Mitosporidium daphniae]|uniref:Threonylcarbamoyl-AMP synthase n=1 Tax=Mitosporidium daphniae TaxID=1485682 RepID=A0A098VUZ9_9MICR|nr:Sua5/YciO/YrdC/YwlC family protein [Mitosporidium daphniae]KGG51536.1 Sua5/YciO/YrdC/YwlC family protein [Mitosporidium daphniae]|eukprot:XP_013237963.1 Sua5/YciO/YrdC/YwlC family protein [Mitosporidium daphniae]